MSKKERIVTDYNIKTATLKSMDVIRLGLVDNGISYIVPVNFAYYNNAIYFHTGLNGRKIPLLKKAEKISFQADRFDSLKTHDTACGHSSYFASIHGEGIPVFLESKEDKYFGLDLLMEKYTGKKWNDFPEKILNVTNVIRIDITKLEAVIHKPKDL
ncbi:pyridoxamine 5'-phosphate oxidase family protein [Mucispirillum schaedleri]|uniref:pyridoxamine 5'-phosphate oxidase family protein n=1 Tax=Mucispirillum schaedleri TaxID=248039 RepID=UPI001F57F709|nr:pyridoxamine 5'-phosphate oxidase family protein [Mucispirillum schaedleri]